MPVAQTSLLKLLTDPRPSTTVLDRRRLLCAQLALPALMLAWLCWRWQTVAHPVAAVVGIALLFGLVGLLELSAKSATSSFPVRRAHVICCCAAGCLLTAGSNGGLASPLGALCLLALLAGTLARSSREVDLGVGGALGVLLALALGSAPVFATLEFALAALALATVIRVFERLLARAREEADVDPLTGALNRAAFGRLANRRLVSAQTGGEWGVVMVDLDDFGTLNKHQGHLAGDAVLVAATARLKDTVPEDGLVGRLGGDEFAALVPAARAESIARAMMRALLSSSEPIGASIGVTRGGGEGEEWVALLREADVALRVAKRAGKSQIVVFAGSIEEEAHSGRRLVRELIERDRISIAVQPIVDLVSGRVYAYEALARFEGPGEHGPAHWFALAESLGMRVDLEVACLERSLARLEQLEPGVLLSVNVSVQALHDPRVRQLLLRSTPESLIVELTEESLVRDFAALRVDLHHLLTHGVKLAVDDMGAGYSNLRQVTALGPSLVKLDRTLVRGIDTMPAQTALIDALAGYAQRTGAQIVAEGIETTAELEVLRALGVAYGQGYLIARPAPPWPEVRLEPAESAHSRGPARGSWPVTIDAGLTSDEARRRFAALPELESLTVVDDGHRPIGLITRHRLLSTLGHRFGHALWGEKSVMRIADTHPLCLPAATPIRELARQSLARPLEHRHDPILLVDERGRLTGQVTMGDMLFAGYLNRPEHSGEDHEELAAEHQLQSG